jgi:hypothetical protein
MFIPLGITSSWTINRSEEWDSAENDHFINEETIPRKGIPPGIASSLVLIQIGKVETCGKYTAQ